MRTDYGKLKNLFLQQSYLDSWEDYTRSIQNKSFIHWDYVILTASNEDQAAVYREQIAYRLEHHLLPEQTKYAVLPDPDGKRVGSGGATFNVLRYIAEQNESTLDESEKVTEKNHFAGKRILVIHSGGDSKRVPQYSVCGKLFSPVPRELPNGRPSTLFDEFMVAMAGVAGRIPEGMLILSGDVLLLFNPLQIDAQFSGAAAISIKEHVHTGKDHGVFLNDGNDMVGRFLHKQSEEQLRSLGAVNDKDCVDLDTGAVLLDKDLLQALFSLISTNGKVDTVKYDKFVNEKARISFYGDFLYPLAKQSTLEEYYLEAAEGTLNQELHDCRTQIWEAISGFSMKLICLSPAEFIHFGTTTELLQLMTNGVSDYEFLGWKKQVCASVPYVTEETEEYAGKTEFAAYNSVIENGAFLGGKVYIENSLVGEDVRIGAGTIIANMELRACEIPAGVVLHGIRLKNGKYVVRVYGTDDNPKGMYENDASYLHTTIRKLMDGLGATVPMLWKAAEKTGTYLWFADLYPVCDTMEQAVEAALFLCRIASGEKADQEQNCAWQQAERMSLYESFNQADTSGLLAWQVALENQIVVRKFLEKLKGHGDYHEALAVFGESGISEKQFDMLMDYAKKATFSERIRIYYDLSRYMKKRAKNYGGYDYSALETLCFGTIKDEIFAEGRKSIPQGKEWKIARDEVRVELPVRVNWGGGWTDTPPQCNEQGGVVLNAAISLNGIYPVQVTVKRLEELHVAFESADVGVSGIVETLEEIQDCHNPYDFFALHKAALIACGLIPMEGGATLQDILKKLGGGIYLSTQVVGVPKGSGLGTSSILSGACVKAIFEFLGERLSDSAIYEIVSCMEQVMSTGGGWQDQVGGLTGGIKYITTQKGLNQDIRVEYVTMPAEAKKKLQERFALIYTGQRRLARNLLRDVVGNYIGGRPESMEALYGMKRIAALMRFELEQGNIDEFAMLLNRHWELSKKLDAGSTNTCIEQIFMACEDLIDGRFIAGAGGGGFLQVILKKNVTKAQLQERLRDVFQDSGVAVWECEFV